MNQLTAAWLGIFPAMRMPNFRLYLYGQLISWSGNWLQMAALGWLVKTQLHGTGFQIAFIAALPQLSAASLSFFAGAITDRFEERPVLYITQAVQMFQAFALGYLALTHQATFFLVGTLALIEGIIKALDRPTAHTLIMRVSGQYVRSATAMNGSLIMAGASIGGIVGAICIPLIGLGGAFILNGLSFIPVFWMFYRMELADVEKKKKDPPITAIKLGWQYLMDEKILFFHILITGIIVLLGFSYRSIFPVITTEIFLATSKAEGASINSYLQSAFGIGALVGTVLASAFEKWLKHEKLLFKSFVIGGMLLIGTSLMLFSCKPSRAGGLILLGFAGFGVNISLSTLRGSIQEYVKGEMRGRVMGFVISVFLGANFFGSLSSGIMTDHVGSAKTLFFTGSAAVLAAVVLYVWRNQVFRPKGSCAPVAAELRPVAG